MKLDEMHAKDPIAFDLRVIVDAPAFDSPDAAALGFGLIPLGSKWRQVDRVTATLALRALLETEIAHRSPRLDVGQSRAAALEFINSFDVNAQFYTNGDWEEPWTKPAGGGVFFGPIFESATKATFDGGILALGHKHSGVLWLEDED